MVYIFVAVFFLYGGFVQTTTDSFETQVACDSFGDDFQTILDNSPDSDIESIQVQCLPVSNPKTEKQP